MKSSLALFAALALARQTGFAQAPSPVVPPATAPVVQAVSPEEAEKLLKENKDLVVLDLRTRSEFQDGHIAGAKNLDFMGADFAQQLAALDKSKPYLIHCASGGRSTRSLKAFEEQKFQAIYHLNRGFNAWQGAGKPVEK